MLDIDAIKTFWHHSFYLYDEERLDNMAESIKEHGILNPVMVGKMHYGYGMLPDHAQGIAVPAIAKEKHD